MLLEGARDAGHPRWRRLRARPLVRLPPGICKVKQLPLRCARKNPAAMAPINSFLEQRIATIRLHEELVEGKKEKTPVIRCLRAQVKLPGPFFPLEVLVLHLSSAGMADTSRKC